MTCHSAPVRRKVKFRLLKEALDSLDGIECLRSFEVAGVLRCLFNEVPTEPVVFDDYAQGEGDVQDIQPVEFLDENVEEANLDIVDVDAEQPKAKKHRKEEVQAIDYVVVLDRALGRPAKPWTDAAKQQHKAKMAKRLAPPPPAIWAKFKKSLSDID